MLEEENLSWFLEEKKEHNGMRGKFGGGEGSAGAVSASSQAYLLYHPPQTPWNTHFCPCRGLAFC